ncbi:corrinoid protein [Vescimonas sp.]|uniref:corrinoid protein n=1 Tax=Vescimonas sp. TaxID=2892404 RepID=UPI00307CADED
MSTLTEISEAMQRGRAKLIKTLVPQALEEGIPAQEILQDGLLAGMDVVGRKFKANEIFVPEVLVAARAMNVGAELLKPYLSEAGVEPKGKVILGTVKGDLHDIGKNLVRMMLEGKGLTVIDLGVDVPPEKFIESAIENDCKIICCSALLTTTMPVMGEVVEKAVEAGVRDKVKIMIGGAPVTEAFGQSINADAYTPDATTCAEVAMQLLAS